jgi:hypothetical protein
LPLKGANGDKPDTEAMTSSWSTTRSIRLLLKSILEMEGHRVQTATSGIDAWAGGASPT